MPMARPTMLASASGELKTRSEPKLALEAVRDLEDAALALALFRALFALAVGHVLAEDHDAGIAGHLVDIGRVQQVDHGLLAIDDFDLAFAVEGGVTWGR
jgi:hypothetical protein